jgi:hypothetical protein
VNSGDSGEYKNRNVIMMKQNNSIADMKGSYGEFGLNSVRNVENTSLNIDITPTRDDPHHESFRDSIQNVTIDTK